GGGCAAADLTAEVGTEQPGELLARRDLEGTLAFELARVVAAEVSEHELVPGGSEREAHGPRRRGARDERRRLLEGQRARCELQEYLVRGAEGQPRECLCIFARKRGSEPEIAASKERRRHRDHDGPTLDRALRSHHAHSRAAPVDRARGAVED